MDHPQLTPQELKSTIDWLSQLRFTPDNAMGCGIAASVIAKLAAHLSALTTPPPPPVPEGKEHDDADPTEGTPD